MDQKTRYALKHDQFVDTTAHGLEWASEHRRTLVTAISGALIAVLIVVAAIWGYNMRCNRASAALGEALAVYQTQIVPPSEPVPPGMKTFPTAADRARAASPLFAAVAERYGLTPSGRLARYFSGLAYMDLSQTASAESALKSVASGWNGNLASLSKLALAQIYAQTGRAQQAIDLYNQMAAKPTESVPAGTALLQLAELYDSQNQSDQARKIYAKIVDMDKGKSEDQKGEAARIAAQRLNPSAAPPAAL